MNDDMELLRDYAVRKSDQAFETLVSRYVNLVYSAALRQVRDPHLAKEITQVVFIILARKADSLGAKTILPSWLHRTAGFTAADALKIQRRRAHREQEAYMQTILNEPENDLLHQSEATAEAWQQIAPLLDTAIAGLNEKDRHAVVLRFFQNKNLNEIGVALGASEDAAKMRVNRALEKLRQFFVKRGITSTTATLAGAISANSVQAAPAMLAKTATAVALAKGTTASASTLTLIKGVLKLMAWTKAKTAIVVGVVAILAAGTTTTLVIQHQHRVKAKVDFPISSWASAGHADPPSALASILWAANQSDGKAVLDSLTPDLQQQLRQRFAPILQKRNMSLEDFLTQTSKGHSSPVTGFHVISQEKLSDDEVLLHLTMQGKEGEQKFKVKKIGDEWKLNDFPTSF
jgi:RNA polymerase sigma factor (sigma-70 family)